MGLSNITDIIDGNGDVRETVVVIVKDTALGWMKNYSKLFTKFSAKSFHGMGLGLCISKNMVEAHGKRMWAKNNEGGKGATFSFSLPSKMNNTNYDNKRKLIRLTMRQNKVLLI